MRPNIAYQLSGIIWFTLHAVLISIVEGGLCSLWDCGVKYRGSLCGSADSFGHWKASQDSNGTVTLVILHTILHLLVQLVTRPLHLD